MKTVCDVTRFVGFEHFLACHGGEVRFSGQDSHYYYPNGRRVLWLGTRSVKTVLRRQFEFELVEAELVRQGLNDCTTREMSGDRV